MTARPYRILVTGSRDWPKHVAIKPALDGVHAAMPDRMLVVIHGDCPTGADAAAREWTLNAIFSGADVLEEAHPADWAGHGKAAGPRRNAAMVASGADLCLAFIRNGSRGASHTVALARRAGIPVQLWTEP